MGGTFGAQFVGFIKWALNLVNQDSTFTCAAAARTCWGYVGDPSAANPPRLITEIPANVQAIQGGRWDGAKFLTTTTTGETLNPATTKSTSSGLVKVFTAFPTYAINTAYAAGVQVAILTTAGNRVYMTSSGGTSGATAVVVADSDIGSTVVDNDITWTVNGYATGLATQLESASENAQADSRDFVAWGGTATAVADAVGIDVVANAAHTVTDNSAIAAQPMSDTITIPDDSNTHSQQFFIKKDSDTSRFPEIQMTFTGGGTPLVYAVQFNTSTGETTERVDTAASGEVVVNRHGDWWAILLTNTNNGTGNTTLNSIVYPAVTTSWGAVEVAATGSIIIDQADVRLNQSFMDSAIITSGTTLARAATLLADTTAGRLSAASWGLKWVGTPTGAGQSNTIFATYVDANNYTAIVTTATQVILRERVGGVDTDTTETYTHLANTPMEVHAKHDGVNSYIKAFSVGAAEPAWESTAYTTDSQIGVTFEDCSDGNNADHFSALNQSLELDIEPANLGL